VIQLIDLYRVVGRRLTRKLLQAGWIVPENGASGAVFDAQKVHRALGRLSREGYTLRPRVIVPPSESKAAREDGLALKDIGLDEESSDSL
jgi:hypothetical protein